MLRWCNSANESSEEKKTARKLCNRTAQIHVTARSDSDDLNLSKVLTSDGENRRRACQCGSAALDNWSWHNAGCTVGAEEGHAAQRHSNTLWLKAQSRKMAGDLKLRKPF